MGSCTVFGTDENMSKSKAEQKYMALTAKKEALFLILQNLVDMTKGLQDTVTREWFLTRCSTLDATRDDLLSCLDELNSVGFNMDADFTPDYGLLSTIDELYGVIKVAANRCRTENESNIRSESVLITPRTVPSLPKIQLPEFSGDIRQWETFYAMFKSLIHDNNALNNLDKVHYLVGRLKGSALGICSGISPTGENYEIIWNALIAKYQDKRLLASNYLDQIFNFRPLSAESAKNLNTFLERFDVAVSALSNLGLSDLADFMLFYQAYNKLDINTIRAFDNIHRSSEIPTYKQLLNFIKEQAKILSCTRSSGQKETPIQGKRSGQFSGHVGIDKLGHGSYHCLYCKRGGHFIARCDKFKKLSAGKRYEVVRNNNWCFNCLSNQHGVRNCSSEKVCSECSKNHHYLLHLGRPEVAREQQSAVDNGSDNQAAETTEAAETFCSFFPRKTTGSSKTVLLSTVVVKILSSPISNVTARFILDSGSQVNLLTSRCCNRLGLKLESNRIGLCGLGQNSQPVKGQTQLRIASRFDEKEKFHVTALVIDKITDKLPKEKLDERYLEQWKSLPLADDSYCNPGEVDGIIGAELFPWLFGNSRLKSKYDTSVAMETVFGYVIMGAVPTKEANQMHTFLVRDQEEQLDELLKKFWELEQVPKRALINPEEVQCEEIFRETVQRNRTTGRYTVALPFQYSPDNLGDSRKNAERRLLSLERKFDRNPTLRAEYSKALQDFINQGHMIKMEKVNDGGYYMAHHAVYKPDSTSTPVRVVLDASAPSDSGVSLNDLLYNGPKLQANIHTILLNLRLFKVAITADIKQMYRQINVRESDWNYQKILWRSNRSGPIETFLLTVVGFGLKASPFLALRTVKELVNAEEGNYQIAPEFILRDLYMDDLICSIETEEKARILWQEAVDLFARGGFRLTKFACSSTAVLNEMSVADRGKSEVIFQTDSKVLGMRWSPETDILGFKFDLPSETCTKRAILSVVARCYDPLGLVAPFVFYLKLLVKGLWQGQLDWDEIPPDDVQREWRIVREEWGCIEKMKFNRHIGVTTEIPTCIVAFADASQMGYGAVVYARIQRSSDVLVNLICAKSKVSPVKVLSIPRLELCAALLLSQLVKSVLETFHSRAVISKVIAFSDSRTVLSWIHALDLKDTFVINRVSQIRENLPEVSWRHVSGADNPADCLSRGLTPRKLEKHSLWFQGPDWLRGAEEEWPIGKIKPFAVESMIVAENSLGLMSQEAKRHPLLQLAENCSSWQKILRVTVWVLRFLKYLPKRKFMAVSDLHEAEMTLVKLVQAEHFSKEIELMRKGCVIKGPLRKLKPIFHQGILRVGGRLENSNLTYSGKHPILLPSKEKVVERLIDFQHVINLHAGSYLLESLIRQKYWILRARDAVRRQVHRCVKCYRLRPISLAPLMADLPTPRVTPTTAFLHTGVDYFGPIKITMERRRGAQTQKAYGCMFVCMSVKAVHLELVSSLSTAHFLEAFRRFLSRRGPCRVLYSDQGTNFVGAKKVLHELKVLMNSQEFQREIQANLTINGVDWRFNTPAAPHQGGLWESNIKSVKMHLDRVIGEQRLTYEELNSVLVQIEAVLNSRPLCRLHNDASAPEALTPAHFLTLRPIGNLPMEDVSDINIGRLDRFQLIGRMVQDFWKRWRVEYLTTLQNRAKWSEESPNITVGAVVLLKTDNVPPLSWPLAVVSEVHAGRDGIIRNVTVKTANGVFRRPVVKLCPLPID